MDAPVPLDVPAGMLADLELPAVDPDPDLGTAVRVGAV
jgi:hypothetical protein